MSGEVKFFKIVPSHFRIQTKFNRIKAKYWLKYLDLKKKEQKSDMDKYWMKEFRKMLKTQLYHMVVTHIPTNTVSSFDVNSIDHRDLRLKVLDEVKKKRQKSQEIQKEYKNFDGAAYNRVGGLIETPKDGIASLAKQFHSNNPLASKTPKMSHKNYIGIELEFNRADNGLGVREIGDVFKTKGLSKYVCVTTDASCGFEVRVLVEEEDFEVPLRKILDTIKILGFTGVHNAGTHVHLDMRKRDVKKVYRNFFLTQGFLRKFLTPSRRKNTFCKPNTRETFDDQRELGDRRYAINVDAYARHQTLEIRMHQGTLNPNEIIPWIKLLIKIVNYQGTLDKSVNTLKQAQSHYNIETELAGTLRNRIRAIFGRSLTLEALS